MEDKSFKDFRAICEAFSEYGELADKKNFNPKNPEVLVKGVGKYSSLLPSLLDLVELNDLHDKVRSKLEELIKLCDKGDYESIVEEMAPAPKGILTHMINAIIDINRELKSPNIKRRLTYRRKAEEAKAASIENQELDEATPPDQEDWVKANKERFAKEYGSVKGKEYLYRTAWKRHNAKKGK